MASADPPAPASVRAPLDLLGLLRSRNVAVTAEEFGRLLAAQTELRLRQASAVELLEAESIRPEDCLAGCRSALRVYAARARQILGPERFHDVFDEAGDDPEGLIDEGAVLASQRAESDRRLPEIEI